jgi:predicted transcriptional regulator
MISKTLTEVLERAKSWPEEDQEMLAEYAREIEAQRTGVYVMTDEERAAVAEGLAQADRGEFATDEEVRELRKRLGVL